MLVASFRNGSSSSIREGLLAQGFPSLSIPNHMVGLGSERNATRQHDDTPKSNYIQEGSRLVTASI